MFKELLLASITLKSSLFNAYHSTDFEVHRNWLAITHSLPFYQWYYENTSEWTLDYPPFFAWFEFYLARIAQWIDPSMLIIQNLKYDSVATILFQRMTVLGTELTLLYALYRYTQVNFDDTLWKRNLVSILTFLSPSLFIVDHIHFQYNGFMFGIMLMGLVDAMEGNLLRCGILFAILLNFKHIYLYIAPAYFIFLLRGYCMAMVCPTTSSSKLSTFFRRLTVLGSAVIIIFGISFGPFIYYNQISQVFKRLFPFQRGLCHAYWAPNVWAVYSFVDRVLLMILPRYFPNLMLSGYSGHVESFTRGLVGDTTFGILPQIQPIHTFILTLLSQFPALYSLWQRPSRPRFIHAVALCGFSSYLFGWHVHEKAIMLVLFPLSFLALKSQEHTQLFIFLNIVGSYSLFPLLFTTQENLIQATILLIWSFSAYFLLGSSTNRPGSQFRIGNLQIHPITKLYYTGLGILYLNPIIIHLLTLINLDLSKYTFLPLMATSVYCSMGIIYSWFNLYRLMLSSP